MVINMDETKLRTIAQLQEFLDATPVVKFTLAAGAGDAERYEHISRVLKRFDYPSPSLSLFSPFSPKPAANPDGYWAALEK